MDCEVFPVGLGDRIKAIINDHLIMMNANHLASFYLACYLNACIRNDRDYD